MAETASLGGGLCRWLTGIGAAIGLGRTPASPPPVEATDRATRLAEQRTGLAIQRSYLGAERTLMAWMRTSLSMISFGFTMVKVLEALEAERGITYGWFGRSWSPTTLGITLISIGTGALVVAAIQHRRTLRGLRQQGLAPGWSLALTVATLVAVLGVFAFGSLVLKY
jgi:putative membrane protein